MYSVQCTPVRYRKLWIGNLIIFYNDVVFLMFFDHFTYLFSSGVFFERKKKNTKINSKSLKHLYFAKNCVYVQHYRIAKSTFVKLVSRQTCLYVYNVCVCVYLCRHEITAALFPMKCPAAIFFPRSLIRQAKYKKIEKKSAFFALHSLFSFRVHSGFFLR